MISVILPVFNGEKYIADAIRSVVDQQLPDYELIVTNDGSTDATEKIIAGFDFPIRLINQQNSGPANARNNGLDVAKGEIIAFIDADDIWPPNKINQQLSLLEIYPQKEVIWGRTRCIFETREIEQQYAGSEIVAGAYFAPHLGAALFRKAVFEKAGTFDESLTFSEDVDLYHRIEENGLIIHHTQKVGLLHRIHGNNMTSNPVEVMKGTLKAIKHKLDRSRIHE